MKVKVLRSFKDKETGSVLRPGIIIDITEERFSELTAGPLFVETMGNIIMGLDLANDKDMTVINGEVISSNKDDGKIENEPDFNGMTKAELIEYAKPMNILLNMDMTKAQMIELLRSR